MIVCIVNGYPGSGKTTFYEETKKYCASAYPNLTIDSISSIDCIKELAKKEYGWDGVKTPESRALLSKLKQENLELVDKTLCDKISKNLNNEKEIVLFIDVREPQEIQRLEELFYHKFGIFTFTIFIDRKDLDISNLSNESDKNVKNYEYDMIVHNDNIDKETLGVIGGEMVNAFYNIERDK